MTIPGHGDLPIPDHDFLATIDDQVGPSGAKDLDFLGHPIQSPFVGEPVEILRGNERVLAPSTTAISTAVSTVMPVAGDISGSIGQAVGGEEHNPTDYVAPETPSPVGGADFALKVQACWPKAMQHFLTLMDGM